MSINDNITGFAPAGQITPDPENTIDAPNALTPDASTPIGTPDTVTPVGAGSITAPNTINPDAVNAVDAPNTLTPDAVNNVSIPNTLAPDAVNPIATPVGFAPLNSEPINRVLTPLIGLNFSSQNYSVMGQPSTFDNALTYSRASSATYVETYVDALNRKQKRITTVGANVPRLEDAGLLVEGASTNLALRSEEFDNVAWIKSQASITANSQLAPDESLSADGIIPSAVSTVHQISQSVAVANNAATCASVYVKSATGSKVFLFDSGTGFGCKFDLSLAAVTDETSAVGTIEGIGNGWYRISSTSTASGTTFGFRLRLLNSAGLETFAGDGSSIYLYQWGAQLEALPLATSYIKTEGSTVSRAADNLIIDNPQFLPNRTESQTIHIGFNFDSNASLTGRYLYRTSETQNAVEISSSSKLNYFIGGNVIAGASSPNTITDINTVTVMSDRLVGKIRKYEDGILINEADYISAGSGDLTSFNIGRNVTAAGQINGHLTRFQVYDTALTANEVKAL